MSRCAVLLFIFAATAASLNAQALAPSRFQTADIPITLPGLTAPPIGPLPATGPHASGTAPITSPETAPATAPTAFSAGPAMARTPRAIAESEADDRRSPGLLSFRTLVHLIGGAVVGGWVGYVGAQVARSDWSEEADGALNGQRSAWVAGGMLLGIISSGFVGRTTAPAHGPVVRPVRTGRNVITQEEIEHSKAGNAYDLISSLRRDWLITRGTNSWSEPTANGDPVNDPPPALTSTQDKIVVYLDGARLGGAAELREVSAASLVRAEFLDARQATYRFGTGHVYGAILLSTQPLNP